MIHADRLANAGRLLIVAAFGRDAIRHADRYANAEHLHSSEGDVTVAAFAVCVRKNYETIIT
jgi:hypothetical protein